MGIKGRFRVRDTGKYYIPQHVVNRYRQRVDDDPRLKKGLTYTQISRIIIGALNQIERVEDLPTTKSGDYFYRVQFNVPSKERRTKPYYLIIDGTNTNMVKTLLTAREFYKIS